MDSQTVALVAVAIFALVVIFLGLATYCIDYRLALLHSSPGYEPFEKYLGLTVARPG